MGMANNIIIPKPSVATVSKLSHKQFRAILKKFRRKKKRQQFAKERDHLEQLEQQRRESSPNYKEKELERLRNSELFDQFEERERLRKHKLWLLREQQAQTEFKRKQEQREIEKLKHEEERKRILAEFEQQQYVEAKAAEKSQKLKSEKEEVLQKALSKLPQGDEPWHNPYITSASNAEPGLEREQCQFFAKTGCCRFGDSCSRGHVHPAVSSTILIHGMYTHFSIGQTDRDDFDTDDILEYEDSERYQDFKNFYFDVLPEFKKYGKVIQFKVCSNHEPHLRGNVYVQFAKEESAVEAYKNFNGRYYAGKQMTCQFTHIIKWRSAICGLSFRNTCPKGIHCNFLHVFQNPNNEFWEADRDITSSRSSVRSSHSSRSNHSRSYSQRSSRRNHSSERRRHRDTTPDYRSSHRSSRHNRSTDSDSDESDDGHYSSSRSRHHERESESSSRSHRKKKHRDSKSRSISPSPSEHGKKHKKKKHKKEKKSKKSKKEKKSDESE